MQERNNIIPEIRTFDQLPNGALMVIGLVELALLNGMDINSNKAFEAIVGASIYARAYADYAHPDRQRYYPAMTLPEIVAMCPLPIPKFLNMQMFSWLCLLGQVALTNKKMGFDGKVLDFNYHDANFFRWLSVADKQKRYVLNQHDVLERMSEIMGADRISSCHSTLFNNVCATNSNSYQSGRKFKGFTR